MADRNHNHQEPGGEGFIPLQALGMREDPAVVAARERQAADRDLEAIRRRLKGKSGQRYWQTLDELADTPEFRRAIEREFSTAPRDMAPLNRREFLRVMGASLALAGLSGCAVQPAERIVPYVAMPEQIVPGKPLFFATAYQQSGYALGVLAESHMGRPIKLEGNPQHPASLGATDVFAQASILGLYDPDRSQSVRNQGALSSWDAFQSLLPSLLEDQRRKQGSGLRILMGPTTSPTLTAQLNRLLTRYPAARIHVYDPAGRDSVTAGARQAFGSPAEPVYNFRDAERILSLDCDFLFEEPGSVRYARDFSERRRVRTEQPELNRLYVVESTPTITGAKADHVLRVKPSQVEAVARAIAAAVGAPGAGGAAAAPQGVPPGWVEAVAADLKQFPGRSLVCAGARQGPAVHVLAHAINEALGNNGETAGFIAPVQASFGLRQGTLAELAADIGANRVEVLFILDANPVYDAPADLAFEEKLRQVPLRVQLGMYDDETGANCQWHLPLSHYLEAWGDARAFDGTASIVQPLINPLYSTRSILEVVSLLLQDELRSGFEIVRGTWQKQMGGGQTFDKYWHQVVELGVIPNTASRPQPVSLNAAALAAAPSPAAAGDLELVIRPDSSIWDGKFSNNGWLQELPKHLTGLTWDTAAFISPTYAERERLKEGDVLELTYGDRHVELPVYLLPGHPDGAVTITLGYGRWRAGRIGDKLGANANLLRTSTTPWGGPGLSVRKTGRRERLATAQRYFNQEGRPIVRAGTVEELRQNPREPGFMHQHHLPLKHDRTLYPEMWPSDGKGGTAAEGGVGVWENRFGQSYNGEPIPAWGMVIDQTACIGCRACTIACQAENNIPTVGRDQVQMHRMMHWIRVDTYYSGAPAQPDDTAFQPLPCMHCENAPCEPVCPVEATSHSAEGINEQTYNRCIGTRYCQNNCPYKVRRFNYLQYSQQDLPTIQLMANPDVTIRSRGVMEKCTFCIQRINEGRIQAEKEERPIADGDVTTACQQVCPTQAIVFGNINDPKSNQGRGSLVRQLKELPLNYGLLTELNTRPRTSYLAKLRNPNPALEQAAPRTEGGAGH